MGETQSRPGTAEGDSTGAVNGRSAGGGNDQGNAAGQSTGVVENDTTIFVRLITYLDRLPNKAMKLRDLHPYVPDHIRARAAGDLNDEIRNWCRQFHSIMQVQGEPNTDEETLYMLVGRTSFGAPAAPAPAVQPPPPPAKAPPAPAPAPAERAAEPAAGNPRQEKMTTKQPQVLMALEPGPVGQGTVPTGVTVSAPTAATGDDYLYGDDDSFNPACVQLRGLPFRATIHEIKTFLGPFAHHLITTEPAIRLLLNRDNRPSGFARVQFTTPEAAKMCRENLHRQVLGERYVEVLACSERTQKQKRRGPTGMETVEHSMELARPADPAVEGVERERVLEECRDYMRTQGRSDILLSMLGIALSQPARAYLRRCNLGLKHFLAKFPQEFRVEGTKGQEKVLWNVGGQMASFNNGGYDPNYQLSNNEAAAAVAAATAIGAPPEASAAILAAAAAAAGERSRGLPAGVAVAGVGNPGNWWLQPGTAPAPGTEVFKLQEAEPKEKKEEKLIEKLETKERKLTALNDEPSTPKLQTPVIDQRALDTWNKTPSMWGTPGPDNLSSLGPLAALGGAGNGNNGTDNPGADFLFPGLGPNPLLGGWGLPNGATPDFWGGSNGPWAGFNGAPFLSGAALAAATKPPEANASAAAAGRVAKVVKPKTDLAAAPGFPSGAGDKRIEPNATRSHAHLHPSAHPLKHAQAAKEPAPGIVEKKAEEEGDKTLPCLRLRGFPFSMGIQDVLAFFAQHDVADLIADSSQAAQMLPKANGKPSGQAVVQMRSLKDAIYAKEALHMQSTGGRYIEVFCYGEDEKVVEPPRAANANAGGDGNSGQAIQSGPPGNDAGQQDKGLAPPFAMPGWPAGGFEQGAGFGGASWGNSNPFAGFGGMPSAPFGALNMLLPGAGGENDGSQEAWSALFSSLYPDAANPGNGDARAAAAGTAPAATKAENAQPPRTTMQV
eukprot:TRINITY_DN19859_c0_g1_i2.p1 TRINITY_DN19859_c0_g1~~TRINITY_DN19859_c0_g1_i2.p1  ORF type:complete len:949 (+),score=223.76 TRINITY_DN19859_c0_g1_i2:224-3070(+)